MADSSIPALLDTLRTRLAARAGLAGVTVSTASLGDDIPPEAIELYGVDADQDWAALGRLARDENYDVACGLSVERPAGADDVEATIKQCRDRAFVLLKEVADELRADPSVGGVVRVAQLGKVSLAQGYNDEGRWAVVLFRIEVRNRI